MIDSQDSYITNTLISLGWLENKNHSSAMVTLKWKCSDTDQDYHSLRKDQLFNHFMNNRCITTKSGLLETLYGQSTFQADAFFPLSYDIGRTDQ